MDGLALPENWLEITRERTLRLVEEIRGGPHRDRSRRPRQLPLLRCEGHLPHRSGRRRTVQWRRAHERRLFHARPTGGRSTSGGATSMPASSPDPAPARPPCWWNTSANWWARAWTRCASWPSPSRKRPPATCARNWRRHSTTSPKHAPTWSAPGSPRCTDSARACCAKTPCSPESIPSSACSTPRESWRMQQESMRGAIDALFAERREAMRGLIRGLIQLRIRAGRPLRVRHDARRRCRRGAAGTLPRPGRRHPGRNQRHA